MTRKRIEYKIKSNENTIKKLMEENRELRRLAMLLSDKTQKYFEEYVEVTVSKRPKVIETQKRGFITWNEYFLDESTGEKVKIQRHELVRINDEWIV